MHNFPLNLRGPQFLVFYAIWGTIVILAFYKWIKIKECAYPIPKVKLSDPYLIAYLKGGRIELLKIALFILADKGTLRLTDKRIKIKHVESLENIQNPLEKAIIRKAFFNSEPLNLLIDIGVLEAMNEYQKNLEDHNLLSSERICYQRMPAFIISLIALVGLSIAKIYIAFLLGKSNIVYLIILTGIYSFCLFKIFRKRRTYLGERLLNDISQLFSNMKNKSQQFKQGINTQEVGLFGALFGLDYLSSKEFPYINSSILCTSKNNIFNARVERYDSNCGSGCGSGCGGSGCGSGCGGCGGCGS